MKKSEGVMCAAFTITVMEATDPEGEAVFIEPQGEDYDLTYWVMAAECMMNAVARRCRLDREETMRRLVEGADTYWDDSDSVLVV